MGCIDVYKRQGTMAAQSAKGETAVKLTKNVFQRAGYLFTGWATDRYAMKPSYLDEAQYPNMEPEVTLYAKAVSYTHLPEKS